MKVRAFVPVILITGVTAVGYVTYRVLLTDSARESLRAGVKATKDAFQKISEAVSDAQGSVMEEDELPNRVRTREQWEFLGF
ncbi:hypothetical protein [Olsenella profusa]|uniref:Uncharacterized protein n=1 Tax=Olsenella profusa TaxID=138595 RepID=A0ABS2F0Q1_9ACTN|nr:hypothetical protein [Olsenella profusa]MBM6774450.1 hypothetical protein [Olsenella profusa]